MSTYESYPFDFGKWHHSALVDGKLYDLYLLNVFLQDAGFKFDSAHMAEAAQAAVLLTHFGVRLDTADERRKPGYYKFVERTGTWHGVPRADGRAGTLAFPPIEFLSMKTGLWSEERGRRAPGLWVTCRVEGVRESLFVGFENDRKTGLVFPSFVCGWKSDASGMAFSPPDLGNDSNKQSPADTTEPRKTGGDTLLPLALRDSFPSAVNYPYSTAQRCTDSALTARIYSAFTERTGLKGDKWPDATYEVWIAAPQPLIESLLPGALCVTVHTVSPIRKDGGAGYSRQFIYFHERYWEPRNANGLASEVGLNYDSSAALTRAKLAVVLAGFQDLSRTWRRWPGEFSRHLSPDTAIPALTFLKATKVKGFQGRPFNDGFSIEMLVGGKRTHVFVRMTTPDKWGRTCPSRLWGGGMQQLLDLPRLPEPADANGQGHVPGGG